MRKNDKQDKQDKNDKSQGQPQDANRRKLLLRGGVTAGGMAAFAAGYGETVFKAGKALKEKTAK